MTTTTTDMNAPLAIREVATIGDAERPIQKLRESLEQWRARHSACEAQRIEAGAELANEIERRASAIVFDVAARLIAEGQEVTGCHVARAASRAGSDWRVTIKLDAFRVVLVIRADGDGRTPSRNARNRPVKNRLLVTYREHKFPEGVRGFKPLQLTRLVERIIARRETVRLEREVADQRVEAARTEELRREAKRAEIVSALGSIGVQARVHLMGRRIGIELVCMEEAQADRVVASIVAGADALGRTTA